ncbi:type II toxin-antitoxin system prevent-host-death family antitoxin [Cellulomonas sp. NPDC058312]|uniref:type II toxin-antitoxin system prevent-host-death family antitoxin n=1 Tax=Cellulomonas sp. NPDC058312 TaxID=3346441 RepID=UPI0036E3EB38
MTGIRRPWLWSLPTRVELAEGTVIQFKEHGQSAIRFTQSQLDKMFEAGLMQPPRTSGRDPDSAAGVTLDGDAKFLVGEVDLGPEVGLEVLARGLEVAIDASYREYRERHPRPESDDDGEDSGLSEGAFHEPDLLGLSREIVVPVEEVEDRFDDLLDEVERGAQVVVVKDGKRVAAMVSWSAYVDVREKFAAMAVSFWSAWRSGVFDVAGHATDLARTLRRHPTAKPNPPSDDEGRTPEGGDGDESAR